MTPERWQEVKKVLAGALEQKPEERHVYLDQACTDPDLRREVETLIAAHEQGNGNFMDQPAGRAGPLPSGTKLGPYTILAHIGSGGMGEVYRARDTRLNRDVAIKVLPPFLSSDPDRLRRFEQEARAAAALNHPNILAVYQMGTHEGAPYLVSELLDGSTLREQLKRGPIALRKVIDYAVQVARGLAAAHEKGIVHRDLKPENLFVTKDGRVKILDFGLAKLMQRAWTRDGNGPTVTDLTEPGAVMGTIGYMSPEQVTGKPVDHRADIFAFGAVLYEMVAGTRAFRKATPPETMSAILNDDPPAMSQFVSAAPPALQRVLQRCLEKNPEQRFQSASDLAFALDALSESSGAPASWIARPVSGRKWRWASAALVAVVLGVSAGVYFFVDRPPTFTKRDSIVIADFTNRTGDPVFDGTLRQGLSVQLQQTPFLSFISGDRISEALRLMEKPADTRLTPAVAREVCQRINASAVIQGSISVLGSQYVIGLNTVNCHTGESLAQEQVTAAGKEKVLAALGKAASGLRSKLGESAASLKNYDTPFDQAITTSSLDALQAFSRGFDATLTGDLPSAISFYQRAVTLDPNFATAYSTLGIAYFIVGENALGAKNIAKAYSLRNRATEWEQFSISANYATLVTGDADEAVRIGNQWKKVFPRDSAPYVALSADCYLAGQPDESLAAARDALRLDPVPYNYWAVAWAYVELGRLDDARLAIQQAQANHVDPATFDDIFYIIAFFKNDSAAMGRAAAQPWPFLAPGAAEAAQANTAAFHGQVARFRELMARAIASAKQQGGANAAASYETSEALVQALLGDSLEARRALNDVGKLPMDSVLKAHMALALALSGDIQLSQKISEDLNRLYPDTTYLRFGALPAIRALVALYRDKPTEAIAFLRPVSSRELVPAGLWPQNLPFMTPVYVRGLADLAAHQGTNAAAQFQMILDHSGIALDSVTGALAHLGLARAYVMQGNTLRATTAYRDFFSLWKNADPDIPILKQAKAEYAKLQ